MQEPIIVTGVPRSRTSMTCGTLNALGAFGGDMRGPTKYNQKGMYENRKVVTMVKDYLRSMNCDPNAQHPLPSMDELKSWSNARSQIQRAMTEDGYTGGPWFFKTVKGCHFWPVLHEAFPEAKWIIVRRDPEQIEASCHRTRFMKKAPDWSAWVREHERRIEELSNTVDCIEVWPNPNEAESFVDMVDYAGLEWNGVAVKEVLDPSQWH